MTIRIDVRERTNGPYHTMTLRNLSIVGNLGKFSLELTDGKEYQFDIDEVIKALETIRNVGPGM